jgi:hypothetical protein
MLDVSHTGLPTTDKPFAEIQAGLGALSIMGREGDTKYIWDKTKPVEVEAARALFATLTKQNYLAFRATGSKGEAGEQIREFDPDVERIIFTPQLRGG